MAIYDDKLVVVDSGVIKKIGTSDTVQLNNLTVDTALHVSRTIVTDGNATIGGNLTVNGTTTTVNSTTVTIDDPIFTLGGDTAPGSDDNKDRGIEFRYYAGSAKIGFMGWDDSASGFTLLSDATNNSEVFSGTAAGLSIGSLTLGGTPVTSTAAELNIMDGGTSATSTTLADADRVVVNDNGTMKQVALTDFETYFETALDTLSNVTTVGALNAGSITSGFGSIDIGSSTITTTGKITGGELDIDDVVINGSTIGHTDDTDLITLANGVATIAGEISVTTLDIGGTDVTSTAAELNILDGGTSASTVTIVDADRFVINDDGTMKQVSADTLKSYITTDPASSVKADDVTEGDADVSLTTTAGNAITIGGGNFDQAIMMDAPNGVGATHTGLFLPSSSYPAGEILSGSIISVSSTSPRAGILEPSDYENHNHAVGVLTETVSALNPAYNTTASLKLHTTLGMVVPVLFTSDPSAASDQGKFCYLDSVTSGDGTGRASMTAPSTSGNVVKIGTLVSTSSDGGLYKVLWQPQFIADLG